MSEGKRWMALSGRGLICWSSLPIQFPKLSYQKGKKIKIKINVTKNQWIRSSALSVGFSGERRVI